MVILLKYYNSIKNKNCTYLQVFLRLLLPSKKVDIKKSPLDIQSNYYSKQLKVRDFDKNLKNLI